MVHLLVADLDSLSADVAFVNCILSPSRERATATLSLFGDVSVSEVRGRTATQNSMLFFGLFLSAAKFFD